MTKIGDSPSNVKHRDSLRHIFEGQLLAHSALSDQKWYCQIKNKATKDIN
jgi:hypothetical protein